MIRATFLEGWYTVGIEEADILCQKIFDVVISEGLVCENRQCILRGLAWFRVCVGFAILGGVVCVSSCESKWLVYMPDSLMQRGGRGGHDVCSPLPPTMSGRGSSWERLGTREPPDRDRRLGGGGKGWRDRVQGGGVPSRWGNRRAGRGHGGARGVLEDGPSSRHAHRRRLGRGGRAAGQTGAPSPAAAAR